MQHSVPSAAGGEKHSVPGQQKRAAAHGARQQARAPSGAQAGWPQLASSGRPRTADTSQVVQSSTNSTGWRLPAGAAGTGRGLALACGGGAGGAGPGLVRAFTRVTSGQHFWVATEQCAGPRVLGLRTGQKTAAAACTGMGTATGRLRKR